MIKFHKIMAVSVLLLFFVQTAIAAEYTVNKIAVVVNGEMISLHTLNTKTDEECKRRNIPAGDSRREEVMRKTLDAMINDILLRQDARKYKVSVSSSEVDSEIRNRMQAQRMTMTEFESFLAHQGTDMEEYKESIRNGMLRNRMITLMISRKVVVTKEEVKEYYDSHPEQFSSQRVVEFIPIAFAPGANAKQVYDQLKAGKLSFDDAVRKYSQFSKADADSQATRAPWNALPNEMQQAFASASEGYITPPISLQGRLIIFKVVGFSTMAAIPFERASEKIEEILKEPRLQERFNDYMTQLRDKAVIDIRI